MGAERGATALDVSGQLVVARPEAVYFYTPDGRGPCFVFEGALARMPRQAALRCGSCAGLLSRHMLLHRCIKAHFDPVKLTST